MADAEMVITSNESSDLTDDGLSELSESDRTLFLFEQSANQNITTCHFIVFIIIFLLESQDSWISGEVKRPMKNANFAIKKEITAISLLADLAVTLLELEKLTALIVN